MKNNLKTIREQINESIEFAEKKQIRIFTNGPLPNPMANELHGYILAKKEDLRLLDKLEREMRELPDKYRYFMFSKAVAKSIIREVLG